MTETQTRTFEIETLLPGPYRCAECAQRLCARASRLPGVVASSCDETLGTLSVVFDTAVTRASDVASAVERLAAEVTGAVSHASYRVTGLDCPDCTRTLVKAIRQVPGVVAVDLDFATGLLVLEYEIETDPRRDAVGIVVGAGHGIEALDVAEGGVFAPAPSWWVRHGGEVSVALAGVAIIIGWLLGLLGRETASTIAYAAAIIAGSRLTWRRAAAAIMARSLDMNVLMTIAVCGAAAIGEWGEGATVIFLFALGGLLESRALARTRRSISELLSLAPAQARVVREGAEELVDAREVRLGETVVVRPGERLPLDGVVVSGSSALDESPITGESVPVDKGPGDAVYAGSLNTSGLLEMRVTAQASDTKLARIVHLVEAAQSARAPVQRFVDRFSAWYTPAVIVGALAVAVLAPVLGSIGAPWPGAEALREYVYRALVLLVVACPCALVISTPVAIVSAIGRATRDGVLVKGGVFLELASKAGAVALDKTGTLTHGRPSVQRVVTLAPDFDAARVLALAAAMERHSNHPLARAVSTAVPEGELPLVEALIEVPGRGVAATVGGEHFAVGSLVFAEERGCDVSASEDVARLEAEGLTVLALMRGCQVVGLIGMADEERPDARAAVETLLSDVGRVVMLTGDNERAAARIATQTGVAEVRSRLLPEDKTNVVLALREEAGVVVMVGDGVNDAPALAAADVGIALGAAASDTAIEAADVAVMREELSAVPAFLALGRKTMRVVRQNVALSLGTKAAVLVLAFFGAATLWMAVFADTGIALVVIANGLRLLRTP